MPDRRANDVVELTLEYAEFIARTRGITQALEYLDGNNVERILLWRILGNIDQRRKADRRDATRTDVASAVPPGCCQSGSTGTTGPLRSSAGIAELTSCPSANDRSSVALRGSSEPSKDARPDAPREGEDEDAGVPL